ncbi:hypothetical protein B0A65_11005 [Flavobacterium frigidimaris]|uniref:Cyclic nucleotide-binding domain-containing protein n=2 Tax=Flavobacterium frigidimaris TaxID=262320 RepID=A0ABX4BQ86_FLAFR|nr:hypothetical protein B0A65_11005 [Flavobacterium frigidimaris]
MKFLFFNSLIFLLSFNIQNKEEKLIVNFLNSCQDKNIKMTSIKEQYICQTENNKELKTDLDKFINDQILELRKELQTKDISNLKIVNAANDAEVKKEFLTEDASNIFVLKEGQKNSHYFLIENGKIASFSVMNKGRIKIFLLLCR